MSIKIIRLTETCTACPTQFEGVTDDGQSVYIRFRWGRLTIDIGHKSVYNELISDGLDGCIDIGEIKRITSDLNIEWPDQITYGGYD